MSDQIHKSAIRTVAAFQTVDGQRFNTVNEAQEHTRLFLIDSIIAAAVKAEPQFARLDPDLLRKFCRAFGAHLGNVMGEPFKPLPMAPATGGVVERPKGNGEPVSVTVTNTSRPGEPPRQGDRVEMAVRPVGKAPELAMPYGTRTDFGTHPLDPLKGAMAAVDAKRSAVDDGVTDAEIAAELERVMSDAPIFGERKAV